MTSTFWFTFVAQLVNFLVLVWLLKRFLYGRIIAAMDEREASIAERIEKADEMSDQAEREAEQYRTQQKELADEREELLSRAAEQAERKQQELLRDARREIDRVRAEWRQAFEREKAALLDELRQRVVAEAQDIARHALSQLAGVELERLVIDRFFERLDSLDGAEAERLAEALKNGREPLVVRTAFAPADDVQQRIEQRVRERFARSGPIEFDTAERLVCGVELEAGGHKLAWGVDEYLARLQQTVDEMLTRTGITHETEAASRISDANE